MYIPCSEPPVAREAARVLRSRARADERGDGQAEALVVFVARKTRSTGWQPMWLQLANLRPLHESSLHVALLVCLSPPLPAMCFASFWLSG